MTEEFYAGIFISLVFPGVLFAGFCGWLAKQKGRDVEAWCSLGFFFGIFALLVLGFSPSMTTGAVGEAAGTVEPSALRNAESEAHDKPAKEDFKQCPDCAETIRLHATKCRFCGHEFSEEEILAETRTREVRAKQQREKEQLRAEIKRQLAEEEKARKIETEKRESLEKEVDFALNRNGLLYFININ